MGAGFLLSGQIDLLSNAQRAAAMRFPRSEALFCNLRLYGPFQSLCMCAIQANYLFGTMISYCFGDVRRMDAATFPVRSRTWESISSAAWRALP